jgi:hypothetical protein
MSNPHAKKVDARTIYQRKDLTDKDRERLFLEYYDENIKLKTTITKQDQAIKE